MSVGIWVAYKDVRLGSTVSADFASLREAVRFAVRKARQGYLVTVEVERKEVMRLNAALADQI